MISALMINPSVRDLQTCIEAVISLLNQLDTANMEQSVKLLTTARIIGIDFIPAAKHNHFTAALIKSVLKTLVVYKYIQNSANPDEIAFLRRLLPFVFSGESDAVTEAMFRSAGVDLIKFNEYKNNLLQRL